jgi:Asp-tRNA(Asn)/Glu-tRNA(Gln) amidotransferase A subunit family amidase
MGVTVIISAASTCATAAEIDVLELTVPDVQAAFASHRYTARQLAEAFLARIATYNPSARNGASLQVARAAPSVG